MELYRHKLIVTIITEDPRPGSVAATIEAGIASLPVVNNFQPVFDVVPIDNETKTFEVSEQPFGGEPDNLTEIRQHDDWVNGEVYPLLIG